MLYPFKVFTYANFLLWTDLILKIRILKFGPKSTKSEKLQKTLSLIQSVVSFVTF